MTPPNRAAKAIPVIRFDFENDIVMGSSFSAGVSKRSGGMGHRSPPPLKGARRGFVGLAVISSGRCKPTIEARH